MNLKILLLAITAAAVTGCSNTYRNTQTPDDLYYSPVRAIEEKDNTREEETVRYRSSEEREIRMSRYDRRWRNFNDDYNCHYDPYRYGYGYGYYYNPYYYPAPVFITGSIIRNPKNTTPRMTNLGSYQHSQTRIIDPKTGTGQWMSTGRQYNNSNTRSSTRRNITPAYNNNNNSSNNDTRSYSPSSSGSSSSGSSNSSGTPVSRPGRG